MKPNRYQLWERLIQLLRRHVHDGDYKFTDDEFVRKVYKRYDRHRIQLANSKRRAAD